MADLCMHRYEDSFSLRDRIKGGTFSASQHVKLNNKVINLSTKFIRTQIALAFRVLISCRRRSHTNLLTSHHHHLLHFLPTWHETRCVLYALLTVANSLHT
jgi:hypothetical protein